MVLEKTLESPLDRKEIKPVNPKGNQSWIFTGRTDAEAPILWPPDGKNWLIWNYPDGGKDGSQEVKETREDDCWMASLTQWTWVWVNSGSWWCTGRSGVLQSMGSQRVRHDWATELNEELSVIFLKCVHLPKVWMNFFSDPRTMMQTRGIFISTGSSLVMYNQPPWFPSPPPGLTSIYIFLLCKVVSISIKFAVATDNKGANGPKSVT